MSLIRRRCACVSHVEYRFVDCRWSLTDPEEGRRAYLAGHIPGAVFVDVEQELAAPPGVAGRHPLPEAAGFAEAMGRAGVGEGAFVVAYGSLGGAERLWWLLRHFGHDDCGVLLGGLAAWGGALRGGEETIEPAEFVPHARADDTIEAGEIARRLGDRTLLLVDARTPNRWRGEENPIDDPPGRIPGARNAPWADPLPELPEGELVAYCGSGVTACVPLHRAWLEGRPVELKAEVIA